MEIVGIDGLAYEPNRLNQFVDSRHSGIGGIALEALILLIAIGAVFFAFHQRQKQIVDHGGLPFFGLLRVIRAVAVVFGIAAALIFLLSPEGSPDAAAQSLGNPLKLRPGEGPGQIPSRAMALSTHLSSMTWPHISICRCMDKNERGATERLLARNGKSHLIHGWGLIGSLYSEGCIWITIPTSGSAPLWTAGCRRKSKMPWNVPERLL